MRSNRIRTIIFIFLIAYLATVLVGAAYTWFLGIPDRAFYQGMFASWIQDLLFFTFVGVSTSIVLGRRAEDETFAHRARSLYQDTTPDFVIEHYNQEIKKLGSYSPTAHRTIRIDAYDASKNAYWANVKTTYVIKNVFLKSEYEADASVTIWPDRIDGLSEAGRVLSLKIGDKDEINKPIQIDVERGFYTPIHFKIGDDETLKFSYEYESWFKVGEAQSFEPVRPVQKFTMEIVSRCRDGRTPKIAIKSEGDRELTLLYNAAHPFQPRQGVLPGNDLFEFRFLEPGIEETPQTEETPETEG